jgi:hypothetical protein
MLTAGGRCNPCVTPESAVSASPVQTTSRKHTRETGTFVCPIEGDDHPDASSSLLCRSGHGACACTVAPATGQGLVKSHQTRRQPFVGLQSNDAYAIWLF